MKKFFTWILVIAALAVALTATYYYYYFQRYNQDSKTTATTGFFYKKTLNLPEYRNVSSGNGIWGKYENYTRSDRHTETITVYCNDFCKKK